MTGAFDVRHLGRGQYAVFRDGVQVTGRMDKAHAERRATKLAWQSQGRERPCITCRRPMLSEGAHHRMCDPCRERASGEPLYAPDAAGRKVPGRVA